MNRVEVGDPIYLYFLGKQSKNVLSDSIPSGEGMEMKKEYKLAAGSKNSKGADFLPNMPTEEVFTAGDRDRVDGYKNGFLIREILLTTLN